MSTNTTAEQKIAWYRCMLEIRAFEDRVQELFMEGKIQGTTHLCQRQEAVSVGAISALAASELKRTLTGEGGR